jgi:hypothetical protein
MWRAAVVTVAGVLALAACSSSGAGGGPTSQAAAAPTQAAAPATPAAAAPASATPEASATGVALTVDPCAVFPQGEASALLGVAVQAGTPQTLDGGGKLCVYSAGAGGVAQIVVARATSGADANAVWDQERASADKALQQALASTTALNPTLTDVTGVGDRASVASYSATIGPVTIVGSGIYVLSGPTFVSLSGMRLGGAAPTADALTAEAKAVLGRL